MTDINAIALDDKSFVRYCGIGEWYVGTRGGFGDQAAIKFISYMELEQKSVSSVKNYINIDVD